MSETDTEEQTVIERRVTASHYEESDNAKMFRLIAPPIAALILAGILYVVAVSLGLSIMSTPTFTITMIIILGSIAGLYMMRDVERNPIIECEAIEPHPHTSRYLTRTADIEIYYDHKRHWLYLVSQVYTGVSAMIIAYLILVIMLPNRSDTLLSSAFVRTIAIVLVVRLVVLSLEESGNYKGLARVVRFFRLLFRNAIATAIGTLSVIMLALLSHHLLSDSWPLLIGIGALGLRAGYCWAKWYYTRLVLTSQSLLILETFPFKLNRDTDNLEIKLIGSGRFRQSVIGQKFGCGRVRSSSAAQADEAFRELRFVKYPNELRALVEELGK